VQPDPRLGGRAQPVNAEIVQPRVDEALDRRETAWGLLSPGRLDLLANPGLIAFVQPAPSTFTS
jgi:hypothetical protein